MYAAGSSNELVRGLDGLGRGTYAAEGITAIALRARKCLSELSIYGNNVGDEGFDAICEAIKSNKETKLLSLNGIGNNGIGPVGANTVAAMEAVTDALHAFTSATTRVIARARAIAPRHRVRVAQ